MYSSGQRRQDRIRTARKTGEPSRSDHHPPVSFGFDQTTLHTAQAEPIPYIPLETSTRGVGRFFGATAPLTHTKVQVNAVRTVWMGHAYVWVPLPANNSPITSPVVLRMADPESPWSENSVPLSPTISNCCRNQHGPGSYGIGPTTVPMAVIVPCVSPVVLPTLKTRSPTLGPAVPCGAGN